MSPLLVNGGEKKLKKKVVALNDAATFKKSGEWSYPLTRSPLQVQALPSPGGLGQFFATALTTSLKICPPVEISSALFSWI